MSSFNFQRWLMGEIADMSESELRKEYRQTLKNVRRRQERIARSEFAETAQGQQALDFATSNISELSSKKNIQMELLRLKDYMRLKTTTVRGLQHTRSVTLSSLKESGYGFVNKSNLEQFGAFMDAWRKNMPEGAGSPTPQEMKPYMEQIKNLDPEEVKERFFEFLEE